MQHRTSDTAIEDATARLARPLRGPDDLDPLLDRIADARYVLLGEASHGTSDYYTWRMRLTQRLIQERGFSFVAVEGDWPDCYRVNRYVRGLPDSGESARDVLHAFARWPTWMWANWEIVALADWMRHHNLQRPDNQRVGFYGLDVYSLWESLEAITGYLQDRDPALVEQAYEAFSCFQPFNRDEQSYAWATRLVPELCEQEVVDLLRALRENAPALAATEGDGEAAFNALQNAHVALGAEQYYRAMIRGGPESWNIRDRHMADTLDRLMEHLGPDSKAIVWEHNTHVGDARATDMAGAGMVNIGQLARERHQPDGVVLVGFGSYEGEVIAGQAWGAPMERMAVPPAREQSWEDVMHRAVGEDALFLFDEADAADAEHFRRTRSHRAIGVVYNPAHERLGNYVPTSLSRRYDAFLFIDHSVALHPLHIAEEALVEPPETYPWNV